MIKIPSNKAAMIYILNFLEKILVNQVAQILWFFFGFGFSLLFSTGEFSYIKQEMRKGRSFFGPWTKSQDLKAFFFPLWKRMFVWFLSAAISLALLKIIGLDLS